MADLSVSLRAIADVISPGTSGTGTVTLTFGQVTATAANTTSDGRTLVTVNANGTTFAAPYLISPAYAATIGDWVGVLIVGTVPLILGRVGGFPATS